MSAADGACDGGCIAPEPGGSPDSMAIDESIVREHIAHVVDLLRASGFAAVIVFHSSNMLAFTGTPHASSDRLCCGAVTHEGRVVVVCPRFERPAVAGAERVATVSTWEEHEDPYACFAEALRAAGVRGGRVGLDGRTWIDAAARLRGACEGLTLEPGEALLREVRICKSAAEQEAMRAAHRRGEQVYAKVGELIRPGVREVDVERELAAWFEPRGLRVKPLVQSGPNGAVPHNTANERVLREGDAVVVDSVTQTRGYTNDLTRTFVLGRPSEKLARAYRAVRAAQAAVFEAARPGLTCGRLDEIARRVIAEAGFGEFFIHRLGHGIGIECHEPPYLVAGSAEVLRPGMCCTVEPGVYVPGEFGVRIEDDIIVTADGCEVIRGTLPTDVSAAFR
ncbi:MAG: Xaa-Pro peptidase family protein [Planctomycetota bacterium]